MKNIKKDDLKFKPDVKLTRSGEIVMLGFSNTSKRYYIKYGKNLKRLYFSYDNAYSKFNSIS